MILTRVDAWLLLSIMYSKKENGTFELKQVIKIGEIIEHAIFEYEEINIGINRLVSTDYLSEREGTLFVTMKALTTLKTLEEREGIASPMIRFQQLRKEMGIVQSNQIESEAHYKECSMNSKEYFSQQDYQKAVRGEEKLTNFLMKILEILTVLKRNKNGKI